MSIRRLAKHLGLSVTTVSRALAGYPDVAAATRERVQQEAARTGYRPNPVAQRLRIGRRGTVGLVVPAEQGTFDQFFLAMLGAVGPLLSRAGLDLVMMGAPPGEAELHAYRQLVELHRVDGILLARTRRDDARIRYLLDRRVPFVAHGRSETAGVFAYLDLDGEAAFAEATERLVGFGHRDIALINAPEHYMFAQHRAAGWRHGVGRGWVAGRAGAAGGGDRGEWASADVHAAGAPAAADRGAVCDGSDGGGGVACAGLGGAARRARCFGHRLRRSADGQLYRSAADHAGAADTADGATSR